MPVKRRASRRRISAGAEAEAWFTYWETGCDFFGEAADLCGAAEGSPTFLAASDEAWQRLAHLSGLEVRRAP